jgi:ATPase subunit of ABC transporter with duplicated ATPase domains
MPPAATSVERLELALQAFPGALLAVSHDAEFARRLTDTVWEIRDRRLCPGRDPTH